MTDDPKDTYSHRAGEASGPTRQIILVILVAAIGVLFWVARPGPPAKRCARIAEEATKHRLLVTASAQDPGKTIKVSPPPKPSDLAWSDENCHEGKPR